MNHYYFFDASAIVKCYVDEPGSKWVKKIIALSDSDTTNSANITFIAEISIAEVAAAFSILYRTGRSSRRARDGILDSFLTDVDTIFKIIPVVPYDFYDAAYLTHRYPLKAYDAVQLAIALRHHQTMTRRDLNLIFVSGDLQQLRAAAAEGLATDNPFDHPSPSDSPSA